jgi:hypothetical protein
LNFLFVFIYCTEQLNLKNISYWHYFTTKIMSICPIWNCTKVFIFLKITQLHFYLIWFENIANVKISRCLFVIESFWTKLSQYSIWTFLIMIKKTNYALCHFTGVCNIYYFHYSVKNFDILKTCEFSIYCKHVICQFKQDC